MTPTIRLITDAGLLTEAFNWLDSAPDWLRDTQEAETLDDFLASEADALFYGVFAPEFCAAVRLTPVAGGMLLADLFARRGTSLEMLTDACASIQAFLLEQNATKGFLGWIPVINRPVRRLYADLGFTDTGIWCYRGKMRGSNRAIKWVLMAYGKKENNTNEYVSAHRAA